MEEPDPKGSGKNLKKPLKQILQYLGLLLFLGMLLLLGGKSWWRGWSVLVGFILFVAILFWRLKRVNPGLVRERQSGGESAEDWDRVIMASYVTVLVCLLVLSALDGGRFHWSEVSPVVFGLGWILLVISGAIVWHVMTINAFLSSWARLQEDRGQVVIKEGLYKYVRHPMYLGIIIGFPGLALTMGSLWALIPSVIIDMIFIFRAAKEDRMLKTGLDGYAEYARTVRYRLLPKIW